MVWNDLKVLDREPGKFLFGQWKNVTILAWAGRAGAEDIQRLVRALKGLVGQYPKGRSTVSVIAEGLPLPTDEARARLADLFSAKSDELACLAVVVQGSGFATSALRSAHTNMRNASSRSYEMAVVGTIEELGVWLPPRHAARTGEKLDKKTLAEVLERAMKWAADSGPLE
ncbi:MAG TPA: hypothetical protein VGL13_05275 [Polyangiaceae bacterium]